MAKAKAKVSKKPSIQVVPAAEFAQLVHDRLDGLPMTKLREVLKAIEAEVADCIAQGYGVKVGTLVKFEPRFKAGLPKGKRFSPFDGETKVRPAKPAELKVKAQPLVGAKRDLPKLNTKAGKIALDRMGVKVK